MPLFEYRCQHCGRTDERLVRTPVPDSVTCNACGGPAPRLVPLMAARTSGDCAPGSGGT